MTENELPPTVRMVPFVELVSFAQLVSDMRRYQQRFFTNKRQDDMRIAMEYERRVDKQVQAIKDEAHSFDFGEGGGV